MVRIVSMESVLTIREALYVIVEVIIHRNQPKMTLQSAPSQKLRLLVTRYVYATLKHVTLYFYHTLQVHTILYGVDAKTRDLYVVGYDSSHEIVLGPMRILDSTSEVRLAQQVRLDTFDRALIVLTQFGKLDGRI